MAVKIGGFRELDRALAQLPKATERSVLRRVAKLALEPVLERAKQLVPVDEGRLRDSLVIGSSLTSRARRADKAEPREGVRVFMGSASRNAVPREFGTVRSAAQPYMRPAWDSQRVTSAKIVFTELEKEIKKAAARAARKKARMA